MYFGDAGSSAILHSVGAEHARCAVITLDTPGANYRTVWALHKHFPQVKIYVRAHDVTHGITLEKVGPPRLPGPPVCAGLTQRAMHRLSRLARMYGRRVLPC